MRTQEWGLRHTMFFAFALGACGGDPTVIPVARVHPDAQRSSWTVGDCVDIRWSADGNGSTSPCVAVRDTRRWDEPCVPVAPANSDVVDLLIETDHGVAVVGADIRVSRDGGNTWATFPAPSAVHLASVTFREDVPRLALDAAGAIHRFDGGAWSVVDVPPGLPLHALACARSGTPECMAVGDAGRVVLGADAGARWTDATRFADQGDGQLVSASLDGAHWMVVTAAGQVYARASDGTGTSAWTALAPLPPHSEALALATDHDGTHALVGTQRGLAYLSVGAKVVGQSWDNPILATGELQGGTLWELGNDGSLGVSVDDGQSWNMVFIAGDASLATQGTRVAFHADQDVIDAYVWASHTNTLRRLRFTPGPVLPIITQARLIAVSRTEAVLELELDTPAYLEPVRADLYEAPPENDETLFVHTNVGLPPAPTRETSLRFDPTSFGLSPGESARFFVDLRRGSMVERFAIGPTAVVFDPNPLEREWVARIQDAWPAIFAVLALVGAILLVYLFRPIWIASIHHASDRFESFVCGTNQTLGWLFHACGPVLIDALATSPRVLDAWIARHRARWRDQVEEQLREVDAGRYHPLPVGVDGQAKPLSLDEAVAPLKSLTSPPPALVAVIGPGGLGKTSWAAQLCRRLASGDDWLEHRTLPLFIAEDAGDSVVATVQSSIHLLLGADVPCSDRFAKALLRRGRVILVWDRLSECTHETRKKLTDFRKMERPPLVIVTARDEQNLGPGAHVHVRPRPVAPEALAGLVQHELAGLNGVNDFTDVAIVGSITTKTANFVGNIAPTALLVKMFVVLASHDRSTDPALSEAEVFARYARRFSDEVARSEAMFLKLRALADACVTKDGFPSSLPRARADEICGEEAIAKWLSAGLLVERASLGSSEIRFALDPIAEHLAARARAERSGPTLTAWEKLLGEIEPAARGFRSALRAVHQALHATHPEQWPEIDWTAR